MRTLSRNLKGRTDITCNFDICAFETGIAVTNRIFHFVIKICTVQSKNSEGWQIQMSCQLLIKRKRIILGDSKLCILLQAWKGTQNEEIVKLSIFNLLQENRILSCNHNSFVKIDPIGQTHLISFCARVTCQGDKGEHNNCIYLECS